MRLIDAEQFVTEMEINIGNVYNPDIIKGMRFAIELINSRPTAFDKEKVIDKLEKLRLGYFLTIANTGDEKLDCAYEHVGNAFDKVLEIVEKGGIE